MNKLKRRIQKLFQKVFAVVFILLGFSMAIYAQNSFLEGKVLDAKTGDPVPYVNILIKNTTRGTMTDTLGHYKLPYPAPKDTLLFSAVGFYTVQKVIPRIHLSSLTVDLRPKTTDLSEIQVAPDDGPMRRLFHKIIKHKDQNNPEQFQKYSYQKYTKWEYQINHVSDKIINSKAFIKNKNLFKTAPDGSKYLPLYFSEQLVKNEVQKDPPLQKSTVLADKTKGVGILNDLEISGYTSALDIEVNYYDNFINLFTQNFVSPIANNGWFYYKYFLADSMLVGEHKIYRVNYQPRRVGENTFKGYFLVDDQYYSIMEIDGDLSTTSKINFLKSLRLKSNYNFVNDSTPFYKRVQIDAVFDYVPFKNAKRDPKHLSLYYTQVSNIDQVKIDPPKPIKLSSPRAKYETIAAPNAYRRDSDYWDTHRLESLDSTDIIANSVIDSISDIKVVRTANKLARMSMTSYYDIGKIELGPFTRFFNTDKVEKYHVFMGARTSQEISDHMMLWGGLGYATRIKKVDGMGGFGYKFNTPHRQVLKVSYDNKMIRFGENEKILNLYENAFTATENNLISQLFKHDELDEMYREKLASIDYEHEWYPGFLTRLKAEYRQHETAEFYPFLRNGSPVSSVSAWGVSMDSRWSWQEKVVDKGFLRLYMGTEYPIIHLTIGGGQVFYGGKRSFYGKLESTVKQEVNVGQSRFDYAIEAGYYLGKLPYTMLDIPRGNETYGLYSYDFNLMNYLEFIQDKYIHAYLEYHFNGFFIRRIPLLRKTGLREVVSSKILVGGLSNRHEAVLSFPTEITKLNNPYMELGVGLENIFRLFQVQAIWRVHPSSIIGAPSFGVRARFEIIL